MRGMLAAFGRAFLVDLSPLRTSRSYRRLFLGTGLVQVGRQLSVVAIPFQVYQLTQSTLALGLLGLAQVIPLIAVSFVGGGIADAYNRRRILIAAPLLLTLTAAALATNAFIARPAVWALYVLAGVNAAITAIDLPARAAVTPTLVGPDLLASSLALEHILRNLAKAVVPALGGLLIVVAGVGITYLAEAVLFICAALLLIRLPNLHLQGGGRPFTLESILEGIRFLRARRLLKGVFLADLVATVLGTPTALFPAVGATFGDSAAIVGLLYAAPGAGALVAALTSGWIRQVQRQGRAVLVAVGLWGAAIVGFGITNTLAVALPLLALAGAADLVSAIFRNTILQLSVPDSLRGRLSSLNLAVVASGPRLGDLEAGAVAALTSTPISIVSGGLACVVGTFIVASRFPELVRYDKAQPET